MTTIGGVPVNMASIEWLPRDCLNTVPLHTSSFKEVKVLKAIREDKVVHGEQLNAKSTCHLGFEMHTKDN